MGGRRSTYHKTINDIMNLIESGVSHPDGRLPAARDLALKLGVSRTAIREALFALQAQGILTIKPRSGAYIVNKPNTNLSGLPQIKSFELTEALALLAVESAVIAAPMMTEDMFLKMGSFIEIMSNRVQSDMTSREAYIAFHTTIVCATNNQTIVSMIEMMWQKRAQSYMLDNISLNNIAHFEQDHIAILDALKNRDTKAVRKAMQVHFSRLMETLIVTSEKEAYEKIRHKAVETRSRFLMVAQMT